LARNVAHLAIVGCGFAGTSALFQAVDRYPLASITVFEASGDFGPGFPYKADDCPDYLLNNTTDTLCLAPGNRRAFITWLAAHPEIATDVAPKGHLPRRAYGAFLKDTVHAARTMAAIKGIAVTLVPEAVTGLRRDAATGALTLLHGARETPADAAILTTGRCPQADRVPPPPPGSSARYVPDHIRSTALDDVPLDATVHVLGSSLSAYDILNRLFAPETGCRFERVGDDLRFVAGPNARHVVLCSRSGRLKNVQSRSPRALDRRHFTAEALRRQAGTEGLSLTQVLAALVSEAAAHGITLDLDAMRDPYAGCADSAAMQQRAGDLLAAAIARAADPQGRNFLVDLFAQAQLDIWQLFGERRLRPDAEQLYRDAFETAVVAYAAPCPISTAEKLLALLRAGRVTLLKGTQAVTFDTTRDAYALGHDFGTAHARILVNATGALDRDVTSPGQTPLIQDLVRQGLMRPYSLAGRPSRGADVDMATLRLPDADNIYVASMLLWGPGFFTSSAFLMAMCVERILGAMFEPGA
jgi:uncharacterized NAD(P)/FAD-binding protein YdhS